MNSTTYLTGTKPKVRTNLTKQLESKTLSKYSTFRILAHLYSRHQVEILYGAVFSLLAVIIFSKLG